jgi:hypothetical protein
MVLKQLAVAVAVAISSPLSAAVLPAPGAAAAPVAPNAPALSDIREGVKTPDLLDGQPLPVPDRVGRRGGSEPKTSQRDPREGPQRGADQPVVTPPVGTVRQWVGSNLNTYYRKDYTLRGVGRYVEVWVANDLAFPAGDCRNSVPGSTTVTDEQIVGMIDEFDTTMYPRETAAFSTPPDRDGTEALLKADPNGNGGNYTGGGEKTVTLVDNIRDENYYTFPEAATYVAGFFSASLAEAFDRNIMTIDVFDWLHRTTANPPDEPTGDLCTSRPSRPRLYEGVFAHEWQHLLHHYTDPHEATWLNEGLSEFAVALDGYANSAATVFDPAPDKHVICFQGYGPVKTPYNPNPMDCGGPQNSLTLWGEVVSGNEILADYGNAFSFVLFLYDRYGVDFVSKLHKDGTRQGLASLESQLASIGVADPYSVIHDYQSMTLVDNMVGSSRDGVMRGVSRHRVTTKSLRSAVNLDNPEAYQLPGAAPNGADYVPLRKAGKDIAGRDLRTVAFSGSKALPALPLTWSVISDDPDRNGNPVLFSGNASDTDSAMVVPVTVPAADPTLRFLAKYGAEEGYDYGYVAVSTDGGATYATLSCDRTTVGPLGAGLNGQTAGFEPHAFDLSAYAGQQVLVSFRYVSDGGVNDGGFLVDDLTLGERLISDGSSLDPFDSPTEVRPVTVANWNLRLVGIDKARHRAHQFAFDGTAVLHLTRNSPQLRALRQFETIVAIVAYDDPTEQGRQFAPYALTVNGVLQPGGTPSP